MQLELTWREHRKNIRAGGWPTFDAYSAAVERPFITPLRQSGMVVKLHKRSYYPLPDTPDGANYQFEVVWVIEPASMLVDIPGPPREP